MLRIHRIAPVIFLSAIFVIAYPWKSLISQQEVRNYRVLCVQAPDGCSCRDGKKRLFHYEAVQSTGHFDGTWIGVDAGRGECLFPAVSLEELPDSPPANAPRIPGLTHIPVPLEDFVKRLPGGKKATTRSLADLPRLDAGLFYPTFYHLAWEGYHPGKEVSILDDRGQKLGRASEEFLRQVMWEGSGISLEGVKLHYTGTPMRFETYGERVLWGHGAGYGYQVFPYRTLAVNYPGICETLGERAPGPCGKRELIGRMVFLPEIAEKKIPMEDGRPHDGYFCLTDTGSPAYIKRDRIDIFVGLHGGGNPYLHPSRRSNLLIRGGIENLIPSDWHLWTTPKDRVWCPREELPKDPRSPGPRDCTHDYHTVAARKALHLQFLFDGKGGPVYCKKNPFRKS